MLVPPAAYPATSDVSPQDFLNPSKEGMADAVFCILLFIGYNIFVYSVIACSASSLEGYAARRGVCIREVRTMN